MTMDTNAKYISKNTISMIPYKTFFGRVVYQANATFGPRVQDGLQLVGIEKGHATITIDGK